MKSLFKNLGAIACFRERCLPSARISMKPSLRVIGTLLASGTLLISQIVQQPLPVYAAGTVCAVPGKDGNNVTLSGIINTYYPGTASVSAGATSIPVGTSSGASTSIAAGDLLLVIQMQGAVINSTNTDAYGDGKGGDVPALQAGGAQPPNGASGFISATAGIYEYVVATGAVSGGTVPIKGVGSGNGLLNSYTNAIATTTQGQQTYQVVRVPQYTNASLSSTPTAQRWNGSTGGIIAFDVAKNLNLNSGTIDVSGEGFRGGGGRKLGGSAGGVNTDFVTLSTKNFNGSKGEGIAGTPEYMIDTSAATPTLINTTVEGYPNGSYGRGAPATGGGGSTDGHPSANDQNSGGGGGGNGGEGGIGGRSWSSDLPTGGFGGGKYTLAATDHLVMGGGGGAGTTNDGTSYPANSISNGLASSGAAGGGMVMIRAGSVSGTGTINTNGANAFNVQNDGGGGGGAGGSVLVDAVSNNLTGLTINANGGKGGNPVFSAPHGPGGGGGGGVVVANPGATISVAGGSSGLTGSPTPSNPLGSTSGNGLSLNPPLTVVPGSSSGADCSVGSITGKVINDANNNGVVDAGETGFSSAVTVTLKDSSNNTLATTTTAADGTYTFNNVAVGTGDKVVVTPPANTTETLDPDGTKDNQTVVNVTAGAATTVNPFAYAASVSGTPKLLLVKRITAINSVSFNQFVDDPNSTDDNDPNWPTPASTYLRGAIDGGLVKPGDQLEYTIYFLSKGTNDATNVSICDPIPNNTTFIPTAFNGLTPTDGGLPGADLGIALALDSTKLPTTPSVYLSNVADADRGQFFSPGTTLPAACLGNNNTNGAVVINAVKSPNTLPHATASGTPTNSYGFVRFRVKVK